MNIQFDNDQQLVREYINGQESALEALITRHRDRIYSYVYLLVKDHALAEDVFQDTFFKVIKTLKKGKYNEEGKFLPWVMRIAHNLVIDHFRKAKKMPYLRSKNNDEDEFDIFSILKDSAPSVEDTMVESQIYGDVRKLVEFLPEEQKEVVIMRHFKGMNFKDISEETGVSINTALGRMRYALINLRKMIEEKDIVLTRS